MFVDAVATGLWPVSRRAVIRKRDGPQGRGYKGAAVLIALTFRELETFSRAGLSGFFALLHARIAAKQTLGLK